MESEAELRARTKVLYNARRRHFHWLWADGTTYCEIHQLPYRSWMRLRTISEIPSSSQHVCKRCRRVMTRLKKGKKTLV